MNGDKLFGVYDGMTLETVLCEKCLAEVRAERPLSDTETVAELSDDEADDCECTECRLDAAHQFER